MSRACFAVLALATVLVVSAFWKTTSGRPFFYDEADYMYAGTRGFVNNYLDRPSLSTVEFVLQGLSMARDKSQNRDKSKLVRSAGDITFYRHYHGPVYAYWVALCQTMGCRNEADYRASGLLLHGLVTVLIFLFFRIAFPEYAPVAAFAAALAFLLNRTALVAATGITQHVMFGLTAALTLFPLALFCRTGERRLWYLTVAALGVAFATVETSFILVAAVVLVLALNAHKTGWKPALTLLWKGTLVFLLAILVVWPKGVLALGGLKGYLYLGYMALVRKTFTPIGPMALWLFKIRTYPEEFIIPALSLVAVTAGWKKLAARQAVLPYLVFAWLFFAATLVITLPYVYYLDALLVSCTFVIGVAFGELWKRTAAARIIASAVLLASLGFMSVRYYNETLEARGVHDPRLELLSYLKTVDRSRTYYVPFELVPTLHLYQPELNTNGYDSTWSPARLADAMKSSGPAELLCEEQLCGAVASLTPGSQTGNSPVMSADRELQKGPLYSLTPGLSR